MEEVTASENWQIAEMTVEVTRDPSVLVSVCPPNVTKHGSIGIKQCKLVCLLVVRSLKRNGNQSKDWVVNCSTHSSYRSIISSLYVLWKLWIDSLWCNTVPVQTVSDWCSSSDINHHLMACLHACVCLYVRCVALYRTSSKVITHTSPEISSSHCLSQQE